MSGDDPRFHALEKLPCGYLVIDDGGRIVGHNQMLLQTLGVSEVALSRALFTGLLTPASRALYQSYLYPLLRLGGHVDEVEVCLRSLDGRPVDALLSARRDDAEGLVYAVLIPLRRRRELQDQLLTAKRVAEHVPGVLFQVVRNKLGHWSMPYASQALRELYGLLPRDVAHDLRSWYEAIHPDDVALVRRSFAVSATSSQPLRFEHRVVAGGRERWLAAEADPRVHPDGTVVFHGYISDITERRRMEDALHEKEAAVRASHLKSEFLARVSHELRTPLNSILGFAQLLVLERAAELLPADRDKLMHIERAGRDLLQLINEVLDVSRIEAGELALAPEKVRVEPVLRHVLQLVAPLAESRRVRFALTVDPMFTFWADRQRLQQVLLNLVSNAVKYNVLGGGVRIVARLCSAAAGAPARVQISVADDGPGFTPEQRTQLFLPFRRLGAEHTRTEGSGLGLVIARALVEKMGGELQLVSTPGHGAEFRFALPASDTADLATSAEALDPTRPSSSIPPSACHKRVLYVEDNPLNIALMQAVFSTRPGYELLIAETARDGEDRVAALMPDLILLDMHLPDADGDELLARLRAVHGARLARVIAVSADAVPDDIARARERGFDDYWTKPINVRRTIESLDQLLGESPVEVAAGP